MPQKLRRKDAPIDWSVRAVGNHPVLTSGVGACVTAFATAEALMGVFLAMIRWEHGPEAIEKWAKIRTIREKLRLVNTEAEIAGPHCRKIAVQVLDSFTSLSKKRSKLAHGVFGIVIDRDNEFACRPGNAAADRMADGLASSNMKASPKPPTWIYKPRDFAELAEECAETCDKIEAALNALPIIHGLSDPLPSARRVPSRP